MSVLSMPEWETFRRESQSPQNPSIIAGLSLSHHRFHTTFSSEQTKLVMLFTPASCFLGEFHALDEHSKQFRLNNAKTTLQTYLAAQESSNSLFHEGDSSSSTPPIVVMWNDVTTHFESPLLPHTATLVVVVPDRGLDNVSKMHQEMSAVTSRIPTLVVSHDVSIDNNNNVVGARVFGLPLLTHMTVAGGGGRDFDGTTQQRCAPLSSLVSGIQFLSFEFLIASLHFGQWCVPEDYLLPQFHGNACKLPDWQYYRTLCPPCAPHVLDGLSTLTSLANMPKGETSAAGRKRVRCVSAEESQKMLHNLELLTRNEYPTVVGPLTSVAPPNVHHGNERECGGRQSAPKHAIVSNHQNGSWQLAEAPATFTDLMAERGNCFSQATLPSSHSWTLPRLLSDALQSFVGTAIDSAVDVAGLGTSEQRVLRTVAKYSSALHRCFQIHHHHKNLTTTATHTPPSSSLAPLELVWIAIGNELGVSGDDAFNQFSSLVIPPKKRPHNDPHSSSVAAAKNEEALNLQRMNAVHDCVSVLDPLQELRNRHCAPPPSMTTHDVAEGTTAVDNSAVASSIDASLSLLDSAEFDKALQFRVALPRIDQAISIQSEAVDKLLLVVQQCLLDKLRDSLVPQHHPQQHDV